MNDIEKKISEELDLLIPDMSERLINHPIKKAEKKISKKGIFFPIGGFALALASFLFFILIFRGNESISRFDYYIVEINPQVMISTDLDGNICEVKSGNNDADELLFLIGDNLVGMDINKGIKYIASTALEIGYFEADDDNAMKVSSTNEAGLYNIKDNLATMFCNQGYYVAIVTSKFEDNDLDFDNISSFFYLNDLASEEFESTYINSYYKDYLKQDLEVINQMNECIINLNNIYDYLFYNNKIPTMIKDYWYLKKNEDHIKLDGEIVNKMNEFEKNLNDFYNLSNVSIENYYDLQEYSYKLSFMINITNNLETNLDSINFEELIEIVNELINLLEIVSPDISNELKKFNNIPQNIDECREKIKSISIKNVNRKITNYKEEYESEKKQINQDDYKKFEDKIIENYGSLEEYYKNKEKK